MGNISKIINAKVIYEGESKYSGSYFKIKLEEPVSNWTLTSLKDRIIINIIGDQYHYSIGDNDEIYTDKYDDLKLFITSIFQAKGDIQITELTIHNDLDLLRKEYKDLKTINPNYYHLVSASIRNVKTEDRILNDFYQKVINKEVQ